MLSVHQTEVIAVGQYGEFDHLNCRNDILETIEEEQERRKEHDGGIGWNRPNFWDIFEESVRQGLWGEELQLYSRYTIHGQQDYEAEQDRDYAMQDTTVLAERIVDAGLLDQLVEELLEDPEFNFERFINIHDEELFFGHVNCEQCGGEIT